MLDPDEDSRRLLRRSLPAEGYTLRLFANVERFVREAARAKSGCALVDQGSAHLRGHDAVGLLRERGVSLPVILLSSCDDETLRREARRARAVCLLRKPLDERALVDAIDWVLASGEEPAHRRGGTKPAAKRRRRNSGSVRTAKGE